MDVKKEISASAQTRLPGETKTGRPFGDLAEYLSCNPHPERYHLVGRTPSIVLVATSQKRGNGVPSDRHANGTRGDLMLRLLVVSAGRSQVGVKALTLVVASGLTRCRLIIVVGSTRAESPLMSSQNLRSMQSTNIWVGDFLVLDGNPSWKATIKGPLQVQGC